MGQFVRGPSSELQQELRTLYDWWKGREPYVNDLVAKATPGPWEPDGPFSPKTDNRALEDLFLSVFRIPLQPNKSLYAKLDRLQGNFANMQQFGLRFADDLGWFCPDAVFLARWDEAGVRLCDGTLHPCALPKS
jgi:hypothetical protein